LGRIEGFLSGKQGLDGATGQGTPISSQDCGEWVSWLLLGIGLILLYSRLAASALFVLLFQLVAENKMEEARALQAIMKKYLTVELSIMCHFKQAIRDAEVRLARNIGKFDVARYSGNTASEITAMWIVLKVSQIQQHHGE